MAMVMGDAVISGGDGGWRMVFEDALVMAMQMADGDGGW
jgi:hypothetical protein